MQLFINEASLISQYNEQNTFQSALKAFISILKKIAEIKNEKEVFKSDMLFYFTAISGQHFDTAIRTNPTLNTAFNLNIQQLNAKKWQLSKIHEEASSYKFSGKDFVNTSVAELAERKIQKNDLYGLLINFRDSDFNDDISAEIVKNGNQPVNIDCATNPEAVENWLIQNKFINPDEIYDEGSKNAPADHQTVLRDNLKFERTDYPKNNGRTVFRKIGTKELWCVDNSRKHANCKAHLEVFDETTRKHLGTSVYNVIELNIKFKVGRRTIDLGNGK